MLNLIFLLLSGRLILIWRSWCIGQVGGGINSRPCFPHSSLLQAWSWGKVISFGCQPTSSQISMLNVFSTQADILLSPFPCCVDDDWDDSACCVGARRRGSERKALAGFSPRLHPGQRGREEREEIGVGTGETPGGSKVNITNLLMS